jgi:hypothetical protein
LTTARDALAHSAGIASDELALDGEDERTLLELARIAAHESGERTNAPLLCFLAGRAVERGGVAPDVLLEATRRVA